VGLDAAIDRFMDLCLNQAEVDAETGVENNANAITDDQIRSVIGVLMQHNLHDTKSFPPLANLARKRGLTDIEIPDTHEKVQFQ